MVPNPVRKPLLVPLIVVAGMMIALLLAPGHASAAKSKSFVTPSGNIACTAFKSGGKWSIRCDVRQHDWVAPPKPRSCDFDWGSSVGMKAKGRATFLCVSDAVDATKVLDYGTTKAFGDFSCKSRQKGLKCWNERGHGWFLSRQTYRLF